MWMSLKGLLQISYYFVVLKDSYIIIFLCLYFRRLINIFLCFIFRGFLQGWAKLCQYETFILNLKGLVKSL